MFRLIRLFAALIIVVQCINAWGIYDEDDFSDTNTEYRYNRFRCPNEECDNGSMPEHVTEQFRYLIYYQINKRYGCCKITGLRSGDYLGQASYDESQQKRLQRLIIEDARVDSISNYWITEFEPSVFHMINGKLKTLNIADFNGATQLIEFNATHNRIEKLEPNIFIFAPNIETIDLSNNRIVEVSEYAFDNVPKLEVLILSNNLIAKLDFKSTLINLRVFMIGNNSLTHLNENLFEQSTRLADLYLNNNKLNISKLNVTGSLDAFDMSDNPTSIYLNSKIVKIKNSNVKMLNISRIAVRIDASDNQITSIVIHPKNGLIELILSRNNYTTMQNLTALKSIERLDLSFNHITDINVTSFSQMSELKWLNLENSGLTTIDFGLFSQQKSLSWLDISYNNLKFVNFNMLTESINDLFIEGNALTNIDLSDLAITLPNLRVLGLSNNKFSCEELIDIRKVLKSHLVEMHVDEQLMVKFSRNINGIGCTNENSTDTMELSSAKLLPIHTSNSDHNQFIETIHQKINEIEANIRVQSQSLNENSISSKDDILSMKQELMNIRNDGELKIIDAKADILMSISRLFNVSSNDTSVSVDLKSTVEELNKINLERYQSLSLGLKVVQDKLKDLAQSMTDLRITAVDDAKHPKRNGIVNSDRSGLTADGNNSSDLDSLKNAMTFIVVTIICFVFGFLLFLFYKQFYRNSSRRQYFSTNTINTNVEQSLV